MTQVTIKGITFEVDYDSHWTNEHTYPPQCYQVIFNIEIHSVVDLGNDPKDFLETYLDDIMECSDAYFILEDWDNHTEEDKQKYVLETAWNKQGLIEDIIKEQLLVLV